MLIYFLAIQLCSSYPSIEDGLHSTRALLQLYRDYQRREQGDFSELRMSPKRLAIFRKSLKDISDINKQDLGWEAGITTFARLTPSERHLHLGMNVSNINLQNQQRGSSSRREDIHDSVDWREEGAVTSVKHQKSNNCWTFSATHTLEGAYKIATGRLVEFSDQELMDCVYEGTSHSGDDGGFTLEAFYWIRQYKRLANREDYPTEHRDTTCRNKNVPNALKGVLIGEPVRLDFGERNVIPALSKTVLAVGFHATKWSMLYKDGIFKDPTCSEYFNQINHAVTLTGYTPSFVIVKNSWGAHWGYQGYGHFARNWHGCAIYDYAFMVKLAKLAPVEKEESLVQSERNYN